MARDDDPPSPTSEGAPRGVTRAVDRVVVGAAAVALVTLALAVLVPLWAPLVFAAWTAAILEPATRSIAARAGGRRAMAAGALVVVVASALVPLVLVVLSLSESVVEFGRRLLATPAIRDALRDAVSTNHTSGGLGGLDGWLALAQQHGATAWGALGSVLGASVWATASGLVFFVALYDFLADGPAIAAWLRAHSPLAPPLFDRFAGAFVETGKGLFVGGGLTALAQSLLAAAIYAALDVPRVAVLGALTFVAAFVPTIGTAIVWGPIAAGLAMNGAWGRAVALVALGVFAIGTIDNILRPLFQRWGGHLDLPASLLLFAAFGGLAAFGPAGLALGPLALRLAREVLAIAREAREAETGRVG